MLELRHTEMAEVIDGYIATLHHHHIYITYEGQQVFGIILEYDGFLSKEKEIQDYDFENLDLSKCLFYITQDEDWYSWFPVDETEIENMFKLAV